MLGAMALTVLALSTVILGRNGMVLRWRLRLYDAIRLENLRRIKAGVYPTLDYEISGSYDAMLFDPTVWTFEQAYGSLVDREGLRWAV